MKILEDDTRVEALAFPTKIPCRQTLWRRKKRAAAQLILLEASAIERMEGEVNLPGRECPIMEGTGELEEIEEEREGSLAVEELEDVEQNRAVQEAAGVGSGEPEEGDLEEREQEQENQNEGDEDRLAEAVRSWPILSQYQSTRFQYHILTQGKFYILLISFNAIEKTNSESSN